MNEQFKNILFIFKMIMSLVYIAIGIGLLFKSEGFGELIPAQYMPVLGIILIVYGLFRGYRAYAVERKV
jgi:hypothetical protein